MKAVQPEMMRLKELHKEDKAKLQQEMMALYKKEKEKSKEKPKESEAIWSKPYLGVRRHILVRKPRTCLLEIQYYNALAPKHQFNGLDFILNNDKYGLKKSTATASNFTI